MIILNKNQRGSDYQGVQICMKLIVQEWTLEEDTILMNLKINMENRMRMLQ